MKKQHQQLRNLTIKNYKFLEILGQGTSARVYRTYNITSQKYFAVKVISKQYLTSNAKLLQLVKTQIETLRSCNNINIIKFYDVFQTTLSIFIVTELCKNNSMEEYLKQKKCISEDQAVMYLKQILNGFKGLHAQGIMHRDFKLSNVLSNNGLCKIADLGYAKKMKNNQITFTKIGTKITMAPQVLQGKGYSFNADIWSLGVVFYQMLYQNYPYIAATQYTLINNIKSRKQVDFNKRKISPQAKNFIQNCLMYNPQDRFTWQQVYQHPLLNKPTFQLLYSIHNLLPIINQNNQFYKNNPQIKPSLKFSLIKKLTIQQNHEQSQNSYTPQSLILLRQQNRKKPLFSQKQLIIHKEMQVDNQGNQDNQCNQCNQKAKKINIQINKNIQGLQDKQDILYQYAVKYMRYFNQIAYVYKFLRKQLLQGWIDQINNFINQQKQINQKHKNRHKYKQYIPLQILPFLYITYKKSYCQLIHYYKIICNKINIFKITKLWQQYINSQYYKIISQTILSNIKKCYKILKQIQQYACLSNIQQISQQACLQQYTEIQYNKIYGLYQKYVINGAKNLYQFWKNKNIQDQKFGDFMDGLLYHLINNRAEKITPEQFNYKKEQNFNKVQVRKDLIQRFQIFFNFL